MNKLDDLGFRAKAASRVLAAADSDIKNKALLEIADQLEKRADEWLSANEKDIASAEENGMKDSMLDRLTLTKERIAGIADGIRKVAELDDPIGEIIEGYIRPNGLMIKKCRVPLGVIAIIFEARPNVAADSAALCLKSGNACILRGGKEAINSNICAAGIMRDALKSAGLPEDCICLVDDTSRESAKELMHLDKYVDVLIPRGGPGLIRTAVKESSVPVIQTGEGVCHIYIDKDADIKMGAEILFNAKCSRPSVCNAAECVVIHKDVLESFLREAVPLLDRKSVELRADERALAALEAMGHAVKAASDEDWDSEYGDYILAVKTVDSLDEAIGFITDHSTLHSEAIITEDEDAAEEFLNRTDAAAVYVNASTRFTDGGEFGLGAEIGISTQKLHARGPMGLSELTSYKYLVYGNGQVR